MSSLGINLQALGLELLECCLDSNWLQVPTCTSTCFLLFRDMESAAVLHLPGECIKARRDCIWQGRKISIGLGALHDYAF